MMNSITSTTLVSAFANLESQIEILSEKKYKSPQDFSPADNLALEALLNKKYGRSALPALPTPSRLCSNVNVSSDPSTVSSMTTVSSDDTFISKSSAGFVKILAENRAMKSKYENTKLKDVEGSIADMNAEFATAANFHATSLIFMK